MSVTDPFVRPTEALREAVTRLSIRRLLLYLVTGFLVVLYLAPLEVAIATSFKTGVGVTGTQPHVPVLPTSSEFTLNQWATAFDVLKQPLINSFLRALPATIVVTVLGSMAAYGLTLVDWRGQLAIMFMFAAAVFFPTQAAIVPLARFWTSVVQLKDVLAVLWDLPFLAPYHADLLALIITDIGYGLPLATVLFRGYYQQLDHSLVEAARLDGASMWRIYRRIAVPMSISMFAVVFIYMFTSVWNSFLFPLILMTSSNHAAAPATLALPGIGADLGQINYGLRMAAALLTALPTLIVFLLAGDKFAEGIKREY
jgi:glucose/mannose transport system permease protein